MGTCSFFAVINIRVHVLFKSKCGTCSHFVVLYKKKKRVPIIIANLQVTNINHIFVYLYILAFIYYTLQ